MAYMNSSNATVYTDLKQLIRGHVNKKNKKRLCMCMIFFWIEGWVGAVYRIQTFWDFYNFFYIYKAP